MIIISQSVQASPTFQATARHPIMLWRNAITGITAQYEAEEHPGSDLLNDSTVQYWLSGDTGEQTLLLDITADQATDCLAFEGQNFASCRITLLVDGKTAEEEAEFETLIETTVERDGTLILQFTPGYYTQLQVTLTPEPGAETSPRASVLWAGPSVRVPVRVRPGYTPMKASRRKRVQNNLNALGQFLGPVVLGEFIEASISFQRIDGAWYREHLQPFQESGAGTTFFLAPLPMVHPDEVGFCWLTDTPAAPIAHAPDEVDFSMQFGAVGPAT